MLMHAHTHARTHSCMHTLMHAHTHAHTHSCTHTLMHAHTHARTHSCAHTLMHAHTDAHTEARSDLSKCTGMALHRELMTVRKRGVKKDRMTGG